MITQPYSSSNWRNFQNHNSLDSPLLGVRWYKKELSPASSQRYLMLISLCCRYVRWAPFSLWSRPTCSLLPVSAVPIASFPSNISVCVYWNFKNTNIEFSWSVLSVCRGEGIGWPMLFIFKPVGLKYACRKVPPFYRVDELNICS